MLFPEKLEAHLTWEGCRKLPLASTPPPREVAAAAIERGEEYVALLESGHGLPGRARYSFVGLGAREVYESDDILHALEGLRGFLRSSKCSSLPCRDMAFLVVSYEAVAGVEPWLAPKLRRHPWPVVVAFKPETLVVYDHAAERVVVCPGDASLEGSRGPLEAGYRVGGVSYETPRGEFERWVAEAREAIVNGEVFQVVLSRLARLSFEGSLAAVYDKLARLNPSPYMYLVKAGGLVLLGTSPELLVRMENGRLETHPIAGTRRRGRTPEEDIQLEEEMLRDEKERAEHMMLVDLARNDLGRVAAPGTVKVTCLMDVEKYSHVQHIVSRVEAVAKPGVEYTDVLAATFPAGTVSGAPKTRAMELIATLEDEPRGPYAGAVGVAASHAGETAIVIRSLWSLPSGEVEIRAGAGIVYDSTPEREYWETEYKLAALKAVLGVGGGA